MVLPIVSLVFDMPLEQSVQTRRHPSVSGIFVWLSDVDVLHDETDKWIPMLMRELATDKDIILLGFDEVDHDVEGRHARGGVKGSYVFAQCELRGRILEGARWMVDKPEWHFEDMS